MFARQASGKAGRSEAFYNCGEKEASTHDCGVAPSNLYVSWPLLRWMPRTPVS